MKSKRALALFSIAVCLGFVVLTACSSGPKPPEPGTPAYHWAAAKDAYRLGDYQKVGTSLGQITRNDNEFTSKARVWEIINAAGVARGFTVLADTYEEGAKKNRQIPLTFRKQVTVFRNAASAAALQFTEAYHKFLDSNKDANVALAFDPPPADSPEPVELKKVTTGLLLPDAELARVQRSMLQRGVMLAAASAAGAKEDGNKAAEIIKAGQVPREVFVFAMANSLFDNTDLFSPTKLDQPNRVKLLCQEAVEGIQAVPASAATKDLNGKIQTLLKKRKLTI
jgi:hypothetical protein